MKKLKRLLFAGLTLLSALFLLLLVSMRWNDRPWGCFVRCPGSPGYAVVFTDNFLVIVHWERFSFRDAASEAYWRDAWMAADWYAPKQWLFYCDHVKHVRFPYDGHSRYGFRWQFYGDEVVSGFPGVSYWGGVVVTYTYPWMLLGAILPAIWLVRKVRRWLRELHQGRRARSGQCARCGYDLRATPERCPECGHEPERVDCALADQDSDARE